MSHPTGIPPVIGRQPVPPKIAPSAGPAGPAPPPLLAAAARVRPILSEMRAKPAPIAKPRILAPEELERFRNLLVFARSTVEGYFIGKHRSPRRGSSVEFTDYKEYVPGDDLDRLDWRAYGRSRRLYVRQYEAETDMVVYLLVDVSGSMCYAGAGRQSKYLIAARVAAALAYLMIHQGDKASLCLFADTLHRFLPAGGTRRHLHHLVSELEAVQPARTTGIDRALMECNALFKKRGRIVILSDFWTDPSQFFAALGPFLHRKFEVLLLHVLDPDEMDLPLASAARFQDLETTEEVQVEPEEIRSAYRASARAWIDALAGEADNHAVNHAVVNTAQPYLAAIEAYLGFRGNSSPAWR